MVETALRAAEPEIELRIEIITTRGDEKSDREERVIDRHAGRKGLFTGEIERALLERRIDVAIHSAKDLPSEMTAGLEICAALPRAAVEDVLVMKKTATLAQLPASSTVATGSVRRQHQLRWVRPELKVVDLRGNVPTRLRKLVGSDWDGIILARAGLERLGFDCSRGAFCFEEYDLHTELLPVEQFTPAGGQGIVALQIRRDDAETQRAISKLNHRETLLCLRAERDFLRLLGGDCGTPVGVLATINGSGMTMRAQYFRGSESEPRVAKINRGLTSTVPESVGAELLELINGG
ncbi:MAG: hydroxymethylbilane synthase [Verrucomicrobiota bacterium]|nr:hydroxymethylbilane synthase [Verrucomicrobiota bacterium]